ncbi:MAG: DUF2577 domain-containing protein [Lachnospiraceae bacterium]|nr:DUF2577 domain-containing protein [Lachnospiraceae bacterium]MDE7028867.1 DUF2577 domain-containing protein [Lachnospiraceae bacterium]
MADAYELVETLKRAAVGAMESKKPVNVHFGKVVSTAPLKIKIEQKMVLGEKQLILSRNVTEFRTVITGTEPASASHVRAAGKIEITVHNGLVVGDEVILIRQQEGQKFIVWDRTGT